MKQQPTPYNQYPLATHRLKGKDYVLGPARNPDLIARRRSQPHGVARAEYENRGLNVGSRLLQLVIANGELDFAVPILATAGINTGSYNLVSPPDGPRHTRRHVVLPTVAGVEDDRRETREDLLVRSQERLTVARSLSAIVVAKTINGSTGLERTKNKLGRSVAEAALLLGAAGLGRFPDSMSAFDVQERVRAHAMELDDAAISLAGDIGTLPSLLQLGDPDSDLAVYWRRNAPQVTYDSYTQAMDEFASAA